MPEIVQSGTNDARYDRQLRLWGDIGQQKLFSSNILLIGSTITATELAKSLILPGIGTITIIHSQQKTTGQNFFSDPEDLQELNPQVKVCTYGQFPGEPLEEFYNQFNLIVLSDLSLLPSTSLINFAKQVYNLNIPLIVAISFGQIGYIRLSLPKQGHLVLDSHKEHALPDLRLDNPRKEYQDYVNGFNLETISKQDFSHIPFPVLLSKCWTLDKQELKKSLKKLYRSGDEQNILEGIEAINKYAQKTRIPDEVKTAVKNLDLLDNSGKEYLLLASLKQYLQTYNELPVSGVVEDMHSDTDKYVALQKVYRELAEQDLEKFKIILENICRDLDKVQLDCVVSTQLAYSKF